MNIDEKILIEALGVLIEKKENELDRVYKENDYYFSAWKCSLDYIYITYGKEELIKSIETLDKQYKERMQLYIESNF